MNRRIPAQFIHSDKPRLYADPDPFNAQEALENIVAAMRARPENKDLQDKAKWLIKCNPTAAINLTYIL